MNYDRFDADIAQGFNFHSELKTMDDGRTRARAIVGGKPFEVFDDDPMWAQRKLQDKVTEAVQGGDVILNQV